jgi:hypothetical protein
MGTTPRPALNYLGLMYMTPQAENLRQSAVDNNLLWLESFGCEIERRNNLIYVNHPNLADYHAWLIYGGPSEALSDLKFVLDLSDPVKSLASIYIDEIAATSAVTSMLAKYGFVATSLNTTVAGVITPQFYVGDMSLQLAVPEDTTRWSELYSQGFSRRGQDASIDRARWKLSFENPHLQHWFVMDGTSEIGVCQTCVGFGVTGIYSFTLKNTERGLHRLRSALRALRNRLTQTKNVSVYFERLRRKEARGKPRGSIEFHELRVIRKIFGYQRFL